MPAYMPALLLPLFAAGAYFCLRFGAKQRRHLLRVIGVLFILLSLLSLFYLLLTVLFVEAIQMP